MPPVLIVFSHLRWSPSGSRPQHIASRLSGRWQVLFVEAPRRRDGPATLEVRRIEDGLTVLVPHTPVAAGGFHDDQIAVLLPLLTRHLEADGRHADVAWLTTPMALPLAHALHPACIAYDCMEELADLAGSPRQLAQRESALLKRAALVFAGGPSLYEARHDRHAAVHCLPCAVDAAHFAPTGLLPDSAGRLQAQALQGALPRPRLGFHGPIDERIDLELLMALADRHPDWSLVMAGPLVGIDAAALPRRPNLHWLGEQQYSQLPALLAGWDLALLPFALTEATRRACPMQTLEMLAAELPVVSTPLRDVAWLYGEAVTLAEPGPEAFVRACEQTLAESPAARYRRSAEAMSVVAMHSWSRSADTVHALLALALEQARDVGPPPQHAAARRA